MAMGHEPPGHFLTSLLVLKLDVDTTFEWQKHTQGSRDTPECQELLDFVNLRAQALEASLPESGRKSLKPPRKKLGSKPVDSFATEVSLNPCVDRQTSIVHVHEVQSFTS
jgi:hypothetical protein